MGPGRTVVLPVPRPVHVSYYPYLQASWTHSAMITVLLLEDEALLRTTLASTLPDHTMSVVGHFGEAPEAGEGDFSTTPGVGAEEAPSG